MQKQDKLLVEMKLLVVCAKFYTEQSRPRYGDFFSPHVMKNVKLRLLWSDPEDGNHLLIRIFPVFWVALGNGN